MLSLSLLISTFLTVALAIEVEIPQLGVVKGLTGHAAWTNRTFYKFLTIKYAKSPSGERRFAPPVPADPWDGVYDATAPGIMCPQNALLNKYSENPSDVDLEDCLSLDVFTPNLQKKNPQNTLLPVMVFFHGGAFNVGNKENYPPGFLMEYDVILVIPQYRLNVFGFMALETEGMPGNVGLLDQILALKWVHKYIANFNGDNTRVTIIGQSAGACSVSLHLLSPMVEPHLFQQAILHSGSSFAEWPFDRDIQSTTKYIYKYLMGDKRTDVDVDTMERAFKKATVIDLLVAVEKTINAHPWFRKLIGRVAIQKVGHNKYITDHPQKLIEKGLYRTVPMIAGVTKDEGTLLAKIVYDDLERDNLQNDDHTLRNNLHEYYLTVKDETDTVKNLLNNIYFKETFNKDNLTFKDIAPGLSDISGALFIKGPTMKHAQLNAKHTSATYLYSFHYKGENTVFNFGEDIEKYPFREGVYHSDDLFYLFPHPKRGALNENDRKMAKIMSDLWTNFVIDGKPKSPRLNVEWIPLERGENGPYLLIDSTSKIQSDFVDVEFKTASKEAGLI